MVINDLYHRTGGGEGINTPQVVSCYFLDFARLRAGWPVTYTNPSSSSSFPRPHCLPLSLRPPAHTSNSVRQKWAGRREFLSWPTVDCGGDTWQGGSWSWTRQAGSWLPLLSTPCLEGYCHRPSLSIGPIHVKATRPANSLPCILPFIRECCLERPEAESFSLNLLCFVVLLQSGLHKCYRLYPYCACVCNYMFSV